MRILIAEDETIIRLDLRALLERQGYEVCGEARDGEEAVELARELLPDLAIFDIRMPRLDGIEAARRITAERPLPVVMLTAFADSRLVRQATEAGAWAYVVKPFREQDILPAIETATARYEELAVARAAARPAKGARRRPRVPGRRRQDIRDAAARIFFEKGYGATSMQEIADAVGLLKGSLYHYFDGKEALLYEILRSGYEDATRSLNEVWALEGALPRIRAFVTVHLRFRAEHRVAMSLAQEVRSLRDPHRRAIETARDAYDGSFTSLVVEGQQQGVVRRDIDPTLATHAFLGMLDWSAHWYRPAGERTPAEIAAQYADIVVAGLAA